LNYCDLKFSHTATTFIEDHRAPRDALVVGQTWRFVNKSGGPDRRFNFNKQLPICRYGEMEFNSLGGLNGKIQYSNLSAGDKFAKAIDILIRHAASSAELNPIASYTDAKNWPSIVFLSCALLIAAGLVSTVVVLRPEVLSGPATMQRQNNDNDFSAVTIQKGTALNSAGKLQPSGRQTQGTRSTAGSPLNISPVPPASQADFSGTQAIPAAPGQRNYQALPNPR